MANEAGTGWPDPTEPGVPAAALEGGFHWMRWPVTGTWTIGEWAPEVWGWVISYNIDVVGPEQMAHLNYEGRAMPPERGEGGVE
jgi:hypothetical protein